jgi:hypothetical protein
MSLFGEWWRDIGSGIVPFKKADTESHARRIALAAWNAAQKRKDKIWKDRKSTK